MRVPSFLTLFLILSLLQSSIIGASIGLSDIQILRSNGNRRILHQPLYPVDSSPPPAPGEPPPPGISNIPNPDEPFSPEIPTGPSSDQTQTPPPPATVSVSPVPLATQPTNSVKKVTIAISVGIVTLGMLSALVFFLYRHRAKPSPDSQKLVGENSQRFPPVQTASASDVLYIGTVEPSNHSNETNGSPYQKLNSLCRSENYRPSPELQPLPPLTRALRRTPTPAISSDGEDDTFYTPQGSVVSNGESPNTIVPSQISRTTPTTGNTTLAIADKGVIHYTGSNPHSRRSSPKSRLSIPSPDIKHPITPAPPPPPPPPPPLQLNPKIQYTQPIKEKFPSPPEFTIPIRPSIIDRSQPVSTIPAPPPPPPPPPPATLGKEKYSEASASKMAVLALPKPQFQIHKPKVTSWAKEPVPITGINEKSNSAERFNMGDNTDEAKPRLKPLHWDKVRATSDRAMVWDQMKSSSFQLNEDMIETLFGCNSANQIQKEAPRKAVLPPIEQENRVLDPKKSQNIAILLRALNVTREEVSEALLDGNPEGLGAELLETLAKMAPTKEEELKLRNYKGDVSKLGSAERFLKAILDIPFAFKRVDAMLYRANFDTEVKYLRKSFETLEAACGELKNSPLFLKLLEAVLRTGNRMNVGTNRGDARAFKLDSLLKLVDVKGTDGKTTLLHFVVQEIIRSEGEDSNSTSENLHKMNPKAKEEDFKKPGLQVVAGLGRELGSVKKAAGMDSDVLNSYLSKLESGLEKVRSVLQFENSNTEGKFFEAMKMFLKGAQEEIIRVKADGRKALSLVKEITEYFHGDAAKEEAHPFRIFMIVKDFLVVLDQVCKEVGKLHERTMMGSARSFRISASASLPVLNRYNNRQDRSSDEESASP